MNAMRRGFCLLALLAVTAARGAQVTAPNESWLAQVQHELAQHEYRASTQAVGLQAPNRAQGFRTYFSDHGIQLVARTESSERLAEIALAGFGREHGDSAQSVPGIGLAQIVPDAARVTLRWPTISAHYDNQSDGLQQVIAVQQAPAGTGRLLIALDIAAATLQVSADVALLHSEGATLRLRAIAAQDASGRPMPLSLVANDNRLLLVIDDRRAEYPITVKTLLNGSADAQLEVNQTDAGLGASVSAAGDVNGDGFADVIVGAYLYDNGEANEGAAFIYFGGAGVFDPGFDAQLESNQIEARLGFSVAGVGDANGDGFADVIVGAPFYDNGNSDEGAAFVYFGGAGAFNLTADAQLEVNQDVAFFGRSVSGAGDVNGDGFADVIVGANGYDSGESNEGAAFVYFGSAGVFNPSADAQLESNQIDAGTGQSVAGAGDVNGDGFADVVVGAALYDDGVSDDDGAAFVYFGSAGAFDTGVDAQLASNQAGAFLGWSVAAAGDVNGDGFADVIVGALGYDNGDINEGAAFIYFGAAAAFNVIADARLEPDQFGAELGRSVASAGDVNGDGFADVIVGAPFYDNGQSDEGAAFVYFGGAGAFNLSADAQLESNQIGAELGLSVASAGDVNGDGFDDVIIGASRYDNFLDDEGAAFIYFGGAATFNLNADALVESNQASTQMGISVAGAGDVNGDGFGDVIVGAPVFDNGLVAGGAAFIYFGAAAGFDTGVDAQLDTNQANARLGISVAGAGDVNGDGFADVIVGAYFYDNVETNEGAAFVYFGGAGPFNLSADAQLESNQAVALLGVSVAGAGDVNGDGFGDVIVGALFYDNVEADEGAAFVYFGGAGSFDPNFDARLESNQDGAEMGVSVAGAGDVNGDGFADVIVGANAYDNGQPDEGAAFLYFGGAGAFNLSHDARLESNQLFAELGISVAGAGDVNGDGFSDVIVGANLYDNGQPDEGAAFVYFGGAGPFNVLADAQLESDQGDARHGYSVASAGDVNGDGFADVIVGAERFDNILVDEGAAFVYFGRAGAFDLTADAQLESNQADARMGFSVAGIGDANGDGFADVLVGAVNYDNGHIDEGAAFVYFGTARGRLVQASQYRGDGTSPVQPWGGSHQMDGFVVAAEVTSPRGRERARLQLEACPNGAPFASPLCSLFTATSWTDLGTSPLGSTLVVPATGLTADRVYHWRARAQYAALGITEPGIVSPPNPAVGPWRRLQANAQVADIRTASALLFANGFE